MLICRQIVSIQQNNKSIQQAKERAMNKFAVSLFVFFLGFVVGVSFLQWQSVSPLMSQVSEQRIQIENFNALERVRAHQSEVTFYYGKYDGRPVQLVIDTDGRIVLQIVYRLRDEYGWEFGGSSLDYLKTQIETVVVEKKGIRLPNGITLKFEGYPIWGPHNSVGPNGSATRLYFGESATVDDKVIVVHGASDKPIGYYPYVLPVS